MLKRKYLFLISLVIVATLIILMLPAIPQDLSYHNFADQRSIYGIPNFLNVVTNIPYLIFGLIGSLFIFKESKLAIISSLKHVYIILFISISLVCFGSGYYHLDPGNNTLVWDRLPMVLAFMSFFTVIIGEYIHERSASQLFVPLLIAGLVSVIYWYWSETVDQGDLRLYILVQFLPVLLIPLIMYLFEPKFSHGYYYLLIISCYLLAKVFELADQMVFDLLGVISGHSIKHLVSSVVPFVFYLALRQRRLKS